MVLRSLQIGDKTSRLPLIQGGMGIGVSLSGLAGSVAGEGGVGIISAAQIGYREPDFEKDAKKANLRAMVSEFRKAWEIAIKSDGLGGGLIGFNIMTASRDYGEYVRTAAMAGADVIISGAGLPLDMPKYVQGFPVKIAPIVSSERAARLILRHWDRRYQRTADFLVIEGAHAGGHLGFSREQLARLYEDGFDSAYDQEIGKIIGCADIYGEKYHTHIPVIVAGGIMDAARTRHFLSLGADGIQVATPFVVTGECDASPAFKQAYLDARPEDVRIVTSPVGMPARAIQNPFLEKAAEGGKKAITKCLRCLEKCSPVSAPYCITRALICAVEGDTENGLVFCGDNVGALNEMTTVREVIKRLFPDVML